jgi:hypothetical protein
VADAQVGADIADPQHDVRISYLTGLCRAAEVFIVESTT